MRCLLPLFACTVLPAQGESILEVDLTKRVELRAIVDREKGQYLGHPTTVLLEDGRTMLAVYPKGHGRGAIVMKRSTDGGRTWSERLPVPDSFSTSKETPTIHRVVDGDGVRRLILFSGLHPIRMSVSTDDGETWSELAPIGEFGGIVAMSSVVALDRSGHYLALFHDDGRFFDAEGERTAAMTLYQTRSTDGGLTWGEPRAIWSGAEIHLCEPGAVRSPDGERLAMLLRENRRKRNSHVMFSDDEGQTWGEPKELPRELTGDRHVARYTPDGRLVVVFRDMAEDSPTRGDFCAWLGTWDDLVEGRRGEVRARLGDNRHGWDCGYSGLEILPNGTLVATTYGHWDDDQPPYVVAFRFTLDALR